MGLALRRRITARSQTCLTVTEGLWNDSCGKRGLESAYLDVEVVIVGAWVLEMTRRPKPSNEHEYGRSPQSLLPYLFYFWAARSITSRAHFHVYV